MTAPKPNVRRFATHYNGTCACTAPVSVGSEIAFDFTMRRIVGCAECEFTGVDPTGAADEPDDIDNAFRWDHE